MEYSHHTFEPLLNMCAGDLTLPPSFNVSFSVRPVPGHCALVLIHVRTLKAVSINTQTNCNHGGHHDGNGRDQHQYRKIDGQCHQHPEGGRQENPRHQQVGLRPSLSFFVLDVDIEIREIGAFSA